MTPTSEREKILERVREALRAGSDGHVPGAGAVPSIAEMSKLLPQVPGDRAGRLEYFRRAATDLRAEFHLVQTLDGLGAGLRDLARKEVWTRVASHQGELSNHACGALGLPVCRTDGGYDARDLEACSASITECDALVAQTGSVLLTSRSAGGRALSVLPPHHVVVARESQLVGDLCEAFALLRGKYAGDYPSLISFITGPSRTGDIERILVLGAHGPKKLTIFCLAG